MPTPDLDIKQTVTLGATGAQKLHGFFKPHSIGLVGATEDVSKFGGRCLKQLVDFGYGGAIYPVNPKYESLFGLPCYPTVDACPEAPEHVGIVVGAGLVTRVLEDCARKGTKFATIFSAGFVETGAPEGARLQSELQEFSGQSGLRVMGPNCNGFVNFVNRVAITSTSALSSAPKDAGRIAIISQSGGVGQINVMYRAQELGLGISYQVSSGNDADLDTLDFLEFVVEDDASDVILLIAERISSGPRLFAIADRAAELEKPIVALKMGRTESGRKAAESHTGAISGSDEIHDAALRQAGIIRVDDCDELYLTAMLLQQRRWPKRNRLAGVAISGGNVVNAADHGNLNGLSWPPLGEATVAGIRALIPNFGSVGNPTDLTAGAIGDAGKFREILNLIADDPGVDAVVPIVTSAHRDTLAAVGAFAKAAAKPVAMVWTGTGRGTPPVTREDLIRAGVPVFRDMMPCMKAFGRLVRYAGWLAGRRPPEESARPHGIEIKSLRRLAGYGKRLLGERETKLLLSQYGLPVTRERLAQNAAEAIAVSREIGDRVAMKIESPGIGHKTEAGGVRLNVSLQGISAAFDEIMASARHYDPTARLDGILVQEMARPGLEMMLGIVRDATYGTVVVAGFGGTTLEIYRDIAFRVAPVTTPQALEMIGDLRGAVLLEGFRGASPADAVAFADMIVRLSWFAKDFAADIDEMDLNPVVLFSAGQGGMVVDAMLVLHEPASPEVWEASEG